MDYSFKKFIIIAISFTGLLFLFSSPVNSQIKDPINNPDVLCLPTRCQGDGLFEPDFACIQRKLIDPSDSCCRNRCVNEPSVASPAEYDVLVEFFGGNVGIRSGQQIPTLINLAITTILGFFSVYAIVMGIYTAGIVRANATDEETIAKTNKTLTSLVMGFVIAWSFIFIIQVVANLIGLGSLSNLQFGTTGGSTIVIN